jgi:hypothetical protein
MKGNKMSGGYNNYSIRSATLVTDYIPGPQRTNIIMDPDRALGKYDPGTFGSDEMIMNGPGSILQALPDASKYNNNRIFANPRTNPYRNFGIDDRQVASYQVEQLHNNPLSQYTVNPDGSIPGFECMTEPDNFSSMENKRKDDYKDFFESGNYLFNYEPTTNSVYPQKSGKPLNPNSEVVYNLSLNSEENVNPMIALGSSSSVRKNSSFNGTCYSGKFNPQQVSIGGQNPPNMYNGSIIKQRDKQELGMMNNISDVSCTSDRSLSYMDPLVLNYFN